MIEIKQFDGKSITPKDDALMYDLLFNGYGIFNGCSVSFLGANQLLVSSGRLIVRGRQVVITEETIAAQLSSDGTKKGRLYIHIDLSSASNPIEFRTIVADELPALTQEDDVNYNDGIFELELCNYDVSETAISNIVETCPSITGGVDLLKNMEEVMANTTPGKAVDALVVKEVSDSLGGFEFYTDEQGKAYYKPMGADTGIPFSSGYTSEIHSYGSTSASLTIPANSKGLLFACITANVGANVGATFTGSNYTKTLFEKRYSNGANGTHHEIWKIETGSTEITATISHTDSTGRTATLVFLY